MITKKKDCVIEGCIIICIIKILCQINFIYNCHINFQNCQIPDFRFRSQAKSISYTSNFHSNVQKRSMWKIKTLLCKIIFFLDSVEQEKLCLMIISGQLLFTHTKKIFEALYDVLPVLAHGCCIWLVMVISVYPLW